MDIKKIEAVDALDRIVCNLEDFYNPSQAYLFIELLADAYQVVYYHGSKIDDGDMTMEYLVKLIQFTNRMHNALVEDANAIESIRLVLDKMPESSFDSIIKNHPNNDR